ncbi:MULTISPECIES: rRNA maturation RNase YbeY [Thermoactinomyces]|jgi:probable rRNA maturation factor|uniref:Endoribonuclease YbeY n=1 Tax=Thermoactinomyces vulgaris TaxID=2026 RepID=A0ABS0QGJ4_THEVU|nr:MULTISPECIES: rRNA maturation RNase YbeY [Thermoactinomyces]KFZ40781.1 rRNA maturation factor [Thermoactinomyces sp. Gus2-1]KYQ86846.1 rRNA maturation factor [Thermoactinomyces sp. AS95]MBA4550618.1 rRNA maturation RNase YbeY [Thermoactinomyces vulgaris]MBA4596323.1 rRNA maturation RNase YbeY [Thermoactinomyces vulgaris]MBH8582946.1 rRNA maturation RNase YbeY [Thermoactinomyces sp. CICC 10735]
MSLVIDLQVETPLNEAEQESLSVILKALRAAARAENLPPADVAVTVVDNEQIHALNKEYRQVDRPTDVLSFPLWEPGEEWVISEEEETVPLGDIVISYPKAKEQAEEYGHSLERELGFLAVHGFLHLLGYDHETAEEEKEMFQRQEEILQQAGLHR